MICILKRDFKEYPHWKKGVVFHFDEQTGYVWRMKDKHTTGSYPLRSGLANYLWLVVNEKDLFRPIKRRKYE